LNSSVSNDKETLKDNFLQVFIIKLYFAGVQEIGVAYASGKIQNIHIIFKENLSISDFRLVECSLGSVTFGVRYVFIIFCSGGKCKEITYLNRRFLTDCTFSRELSSLF